MNIYEILYMDCGITRTVRVAGPDMIQAMYSVPTMGIIKVELVGTTEVEDKTNG